MAKLIIRVPATSANVGSGFDSVGVALHLYYTVIVEEKTDKWKVNHALGADVPTDEHNLIVQTILKVDPDIHPRQLTVISDVPIAHGLGSSTTAVVAGIKIANALGDLDLSVADQINLGSRFEGHSENVASALLGQLTVSTFDGQQAVATRIELPDVYALMYIRPDGISEAESRKKLPKTISFEKAIHASSKENVFVALAAQGKWDEAVKLIEGDQIHEPARKELVPEMDTILETAHKLNIYGTYLSGAGPTVSTLGKQAALTELRIELQQKNMNGSLRLLQIDQEGATVRGE
ncbi:homoserine kinase [Lentilactobacillus sp. TOM.63]|uniref:homoserine kinase n=1 Tax=Lentilactobacillus TaxID=2767893 RepID=UPI001C267141|nr:MULTISPECIES: homoserine kinase [Lentilactobacillus]MBU9788621.1 homoserine kinase [Lentilactobacillus dabitei]MDM7517034.1 homoserine kinase [Lentilactobacillus sp. TOM.63]